MGGTVSIDADPLYISESTHQALQRSQIKPADVLISIAGTIGRSAIVPDDVGAMNCNQAVAIVRPNDQIDRRFLLHWLGSHEALAQMSKGQVTGTISNLSLGQIGNLTVRLPPLDEQRRIAAILDKADALRRKRKRALDLLDSLTQSIFLEMFGNLLESADYPRGTIGDWVSDFDTGKNLAPDPDQTLQSGYRVLKVSAVTTGSFLPSESKQLPAAYTPPNAHIVRIGDLLFSRANTAELIGATAFVEAVPERIVLPDKIWRFVWQQHNPPHPNFIHALFSTKAFREAITKRASGTSGSMKNISKAKVMAIGVALPQRHLQDEFVSKSNFLQKSISLASQQKEMLDHQFTSLQSHAFVGQL